jgi:N-succinyldiaminopimelate aminotransferase
MLRFNRPAAATVNPRLDLLQTYPFEKLRALVADVKPAAVPAISFGIGEPKHPTPAVHQGSDDRVARRPGQLPGTAGDALRACIAGWLERRYNLPKVDAATEVLPVTGSREALFAFAQTVIDSSKPNPLVLCPNPFYQI